MRRLFHSLVLAALIPAAALAAPLNGQVPLVMAATNADKDWMPSAAQVQAVIEQSRRYFTARDAGRFDEAYRQYAPTNKALVSYGGWRQAVQGLNTASGGITARRLVRITWFKDPPQSGPGVYAAVDFSSTSPKLAAHCGYLVWQEQENGTLGIVHEEDNVLDQTTLAQIAPAKLAEVKKAMHC